MRRYGWRASPSACAAITPAPTASSPPPPAWLSNNNKKLMPGCPIFLRGGITYGDERRLPSGRSSSSLSLQSCRRTRAAARYRESLGQSGFGCNGGGDRVRGFIRGKSTRDLCELHGLPGRHIGASRWHHPIDASNSINCGRSSADCQGGADG